MTEFLKQILRTTILAVLSFGGGYIAKMSETNKEMLPTFSFLVIAIAYVYLMIVFDNEK